MSSEVLAPPHTSPTYFCLPKLYIMQFTPCALHPKPWALHSTPYNMHPTTCTLHPSPDMSSEALAHPLPSNWSLHPKPWTLLPKPHTYTLCMHVQLQQCHLWYVYTHACSPKKKNFPFSPRLTLPAPLIGLSLSLESPLPLKIEVIRVCTAPPWYICIFIYMYIYVTS